MLGSDHYNYYSDLVGYVRSLGDYRVMLNGPKGTGFEADCPQHCWGNASFMNISDFQMTFESEVSNWQPASYRAQPYHTQGCGTAAGCRFDRARFAATIYNGNLTVRGSWDEQVRRELRWAKGRNYGWVLHDNGPPHRWMPTYFEEEISYIRGLNAES
jgi:hypothetical protein